MPNSHPKSLDQLRRDARALARAFEARDAGAVQRAQAILRRDRAPRHADFLHVIAWETGYPSWPALKTAVETRGMDRAARQGRLRWALYHGAGQVAEQLLADTPDLAAGEVPLLVALYDVTAMAAVLAEDPGAATRLYAPRRAMCHLSFSQAHRIWPDRALDAMAMAELLVAHGADVNDSFAAEPESDHRLSALYGAVGHARHLGLARWLLEQGADPNDAESLYHAAELPGTEALELLLAHGADPAGTNALARSLDFDDPGKVRVLLEGGADPNEGTAPHPSSETPMTVPALHQAARRHTGAEIARLLLEAGAMPDARWQGRTAYAVARMHGNTAVARALEAAGADTALSEVEAQLARAADGTVRPADWIGMSKLDAEAAKLLTELVWRDGTLPHMKRLVAMGFDPNVTDPMGMPPLQLAGWEGMPEKFAWLLRQGPDLSHVNAFGGTLLSTIVHGSENCPHRAERDHVACARLALVEGVALPRRASEFATDPEMAAFLAEWAETHPGQVVDHGVV